MNNQIQTHLLTFKNNMYILGISFVLGIGINTVLSFYINSKLNYIINDNNNKTNYIITDNNDKHNLLLKKLERTQQQISILDYEKEQLLNEIISFKNNDNKNTPKQ
jgi:hypothetical protein